MFGSEPGSWERALTVVGAGLLLKKRLLVHEELVDVLLGVLEAATIVPGDAARDAIERLGSFQKDLYSVGTAWDHVCRAQGVPDAFTVCIALTDTVSFAVRRAEEAAVKASDARIKAINARIKAWTASRQVAALPPGIQASLAGALRVAAGDDDPTGDEQEDDSSETCEADSGDDDDDMTEVDSLAEEDDSDGSDD